MQQNLKQIYYKGTNVETDAENKYYYPASSAVVKRLRNADRVKVIMISTSPDNKNSKINKGLLEQEFRHIAQKYNIALEFKEIRLIKCRDKVVCHFDKWIYRISKEILPGSEVLADITYGQKPLVPVVFSALKVAEEIYSCDIRSILYGSIDFNDYDKDDVCGDMYDLSSVFYLSDVVSHLDASDGKRKNDALLRRIIKLVRIECFC